ncbi:hypothetical protein GOODEAATRI_013050 [Goodea atripinnis]|uniref:Uncharacterized protein n=1 Tax=Goodea atripinnis TaxID=208336 RepID=A0ABV0MRN8_9TELE
MIHFYDGPVLEEKALLRAAGEGLSSPEYVDLCRWLTSRLKPLCGLEESLTSGPDDMDSLQVEMSGLLKELHCPFEGAVSGVLQGSTRSTKDHLKFVWPRHVTKQSVGGLLLTKEHCNNPFLNGELLFVQVKVDSMARAYQPKRHSLRPQTSVDVAELLAAREDVCNVVKTSSGSSREKTACAVNKVKDAH